MGAAFDVYKVTLDFLKNNKVFLLIVTTALASGTAGYTLPSLISAKPVKVVIEAPKGDKRIDWCVREIKKLKRWHE